MSGTLPALHLDPNEEALNPMVLEGPFPDMNNCPNRLLLDVVNKADRWFRAWKVEAIWVKALPHNHAVETMEGNETPLQGDVLCRGKAGDTWPQRLESLLEKYRPTDAKDADGWTMYEPRPEHCGVVAAQVEDSFAVETDRGQLEGKAGDYLVKEHADADIDYPEKLWIVDRDLFEETYRSENHGRTEGK